MSLEETPALDAAPIVVIDTSAIVAIISPELDALSLIERAISYEQRLIAAATWLEAAIVCEGKLPLGGRRFDRLVSDMRIEIVPVTRDQVTIARAAHQTYGKGRGSRAQLSYGDCFSYALAKQLDAPLLFKGADFAHTDIASA
jgi:ribonuclease VapC